MADEDSKPPRQLKKGNLPQYGLPELGRPQVVPRQMALYEIIPEDNAPHVPTPGWPTPGWPTDWPSSWLFTDTLPQGATDDTIEPPLRRRKKRWPIVIAVLLMLILASGVAMYFYLHHQAAEREQRRIGAYEDLNAAIALIQECDPVVIRLDLATERQVTAEAVLELRALLDLLPGTEQRLDLALEKAQGAYDAFSEPTDQELCRHVLDAATFRKQMLSAGKKLIETDIEAITSLGLFTEAWELIVLADDEMREAAALSTAGGSTRVRQAAELNQSASVRLDAAQAKIAEAQAAFSGVSYGVVARYVDLKKEAAVLAVQADEATLRSDFASAVEANLAFGNKDKEVVVAAALIPTDPVSLVTTAYDNITAQVRDVYRSARASAADSDAYVRDYVGVGIQTGLQ
ncbi:MAG: hypothetical protein LBD25_08830 [Coriobacteriales bacterium]|jgi:hypothetical protein|nr:hypothetical protein [Coriobacteriales bacterium]